MPSSVTHSYFADDIYNKSKIRGKVNLNYLKVFGQGPDPYFFYDFHLSKKSKYVHQINHLMQHTKVNKHFISLINYINKSNYNSNSMVLSYLYGQIFIILVCMMKRIILLLNIMVNMKKWNIILIFI